MNFMKIQSKTAKLAKLSAAALLAGVSFAAAQEAEAPVVTPGGTKVQIYGRIELGASYEDDITGGLWSSNAPRTAVGDAQGRTTLSIARTRLGLNLSGPAKEEEPELSGRFEADFSGNSSYSNFAGGATTGSVNTANNRSETVSLSPNFRVRQAYGAVKYKDIGLTLLFGMTDDLITPIDPPSINASSLNGAGNLGNRRPQIRVTQAVGPIEIAVAALHDRLNSDNNPASSPSVQGRLGLKVPASWAGEKANLAIGVGGLFAKGETANDVDSARVKRPIPTYSYNLDLSVPIINIVTLTGEFFRGQNLRRYGDGSLSQYNATEDLISIGGWGGLSVKLPAKLSLAAGVGGEGFEKDTKEETLSDGTIEDNMFIFANLGYNFTSAAKLTFEWLTFSTNYKEVKDPSALNRFELNFRYDFK